MLQRWAALILSSYIINRLQSVQNQASATLVDCMVFTVSQVPACEAQQTHSWWARCLGPLQQWPCQASIGLVAKMLLQYAQGLLRRGVKCAAVVWVQATAACQQQLQDELHHLQQQQFSITEPCYKYLLIGIPILTRSAHTLLTLACFAKVPRGHLSLMQQEREMRILQTSDALTKWQAKPDRGRKPDHPCNFDASPLQHALWCCLSGLKLSPSWANAMLMLKQT